jgi:hypothetical protein
MDHERSAIGRRAPSLDQARLLKPVEQFDHRRAVDLELAAESRLRHRLALGDQPEDSDVLGGKADLPEHLIGERVRRLRRAFQQERDPRSHARRQFAMSSGTTSRS